MPRRLELVHVIPHQHGAVGKGQDLAEGGVEPVGRVRAGVQWNGPSLFEILPQFALGVRRERNQARFMEL